MKADFNLIWSIRNTKAGLGVENFEEISTYNFYNTDSRFEFKISFQNQTFFVFEKFQSHLQP